MSDSITLLALGVLAVILIGLACRRKDLLYPPLVFAMPLVVQYACYGAFRRTEYVLSPATNTFILLTPLAFAVGCLTSETVLLPVSEAPPHTQEFESKRLWAWIGVFTALGATGFLIGVCSAIRVGFSGDNDFFVNLRLTEVTTPDRGIWLSTHLLWFLHVAVLVLLMASPRRLQCRLAVRAAVIMLLCSPVFTMSRAIFLYFLVPMMGAWYLSARYVRRVPLHVGRILAVGVGASAVFLGLACLFNRLRTGSTSASFLLTYFCDPLLAFDAVVLRSDIHTAGGHVLYPLLRVASVLRIRPMPDTDLGLVPTDFNVFTCMDGAYLDFGPTGMILVFLALGSAYGLLYTRVRRGHVFSAAFYAVIVSPLVMSFYTYAFGLLCVYYALLLGFLAIVAQGNAKQPTHGVDCA